MRKLLKYITIPIRYHTKPYWSFFLALMILPLSTNKAPTEVVNIDRQFFIKMTKS
ncbi:UNVERIFIED_CONTAM: hypothetical protein GTU68_016365 [Idotea baltica]|nr:hypothetical protein [Idotea baltica]